MRILGPVLTLIFSSSGSAFATDRSIATTGTDAANRSNPAFKRLVKPSPLSQILVKKPKDP